MTIDGINLPDVECPQEFNTWVNNRSVALIMSEGFEDRSLSWVKTLSEDSIIDTAIIYENYPKRESKKIELLKSLNRISSLNSETIHEKRFDRNNPIESEFEIIRVTSELKRNFDVIVIDISVMSKLLILILIYCLRDYSGALRLIYTEPEEYCPTQEKFEELKDTVVGDRVFPTFGVHDVVRTPLLSSTSMHNKDVCLIAFTSFNERLVEALLASVSPHTFYLFGSRPPHLTWRESAVQYLHREIISEYRHDNPLDDRGALIANVSTLDYTETFKALYDTYHRVGRSMRVIIAPTGSKMQAVGVALFKSIYSDVHIEYPMPESFLSSGFSSEAVRKIHCCDFSGNRFGL